MLFDDPNKLSNEEIRQELTQIEYTSTLIDSIIEQFWFHDPFNSFISPIQHFEILKQFLQEKKPDTFFRFDFYYYFFSKKISSFENTRKQLQKVGLYFEQIQKNQVRLDEFKHLLDKIGSPKDLTIALLKDQNIITQVNHDGIETIIWGHHTLTEFLTADYIYGQNEPKDELQKLVVDSATGIPLLKPSWIGVLRFLIEQDSEYFGTWIVELLHQSTDSLIDHVTEVIIFAISSEIKPELKQQLFNLVFNYYQQKQFWIPVWAYHNLYKLIDKEVYTNLKAHANDKEYVTKGNIAATIDGLLIHNNSLLNAAERKFWKEQFIKYANDKNDNGVLNRHALAALENFKGQTDIVSQVKENYKNNDSLVRNAFINMCKVIDPNSPDSIAIFIKAIEEDTSHIYARTGLYEVSSQTGIEFFVERIAENPRFIHQFLDNESIFNKEDTRADAQLIKNIQKNKSDVVIQALKKLIISAYTGERNYHAGKSYFLQRVALIINAEEPDYIHELIRVIMQLDAEKKRIIFINDIEGVLSVLLKPENLEKLQTLFKDDLHPHARYALAQAIRLAPTTGNPDGEAVLRKGIELGITADPSKAHTYKDYQQEQNEKIFKQFQDYLNPPEKDKYFPQVFRYFIENKKLIQDKASKSDIEKLLKLAVDSFLNKIDPLDIKVRYKNQKTKSGEYVITSYASIFPDVLQVIHELNPDLLRTPENRKKVINFIPFGYLSDFKKINEIIGEITDEELEPVNQRMLDKSNDVRYLVPQTYIYIAKTTSKLRTPQKVLLSFIQDNLISDHEREYALEVLEKYISSTDKEVEEILNTLWNPKTRNRISDLANGLLVTIFHHDKAIDWRFDILKQSATPFRMQEGFHSVGSIEAELISKTFAKPLINLTDEKYLKKFLDLLDFSLTLVEKNDYREYVNYLWTIVIAYVARDEYLLSIEALTALKSWGEQHLHTPEINWFLKRISELNAQYNLVIKVVNSENAINYIKGKKVKWTYALLREAMSNVGSTQDIDIFISHASAGNGTAVGENNFVKKLNKKLKDMGYKTFFDEDYNTPTIKEKINRYLPKSRFMIAICSERYRKRVCEDGAKEVSSELFHFSEIEEVTKLPLIFPITYKITRQQWKIVGIPELKGNRIQIEAAHDADVEVDRVVGALLQWIKQNDPDTTNKS